MSTDGAGPTQTDEPVTKPVPAHARSGQPPETGDSGSVGVGAAGDHLRIVLRPVASSAPVAFYAFGAGTILYSALQLQWMSAQQSKPLAIILLAFVGPLEIMAGLVAYAARDAGVATAMLIFGAVWIALGLELYTSPPGSRSTAVGMFMLTIAAAVLMISTGAIVARPLLGLLALLATARFALSGVYELYGGVNIEHASGWLGIPIIAISLYGGTAFLLEETMRKQILPIGRRRGAAAALEGDLSRQIEPVAREAGVRHLL
jgi:succinate-acetate transporter protein